MPTCFVDGLESGQVKAEKEGAGAPTQPRGAPPLGQKTPKARSESTLDGATMGKFSLPPAGFSEERRQLPLSISCRSRPKRAEENGKRTWLGGGRSGAGAV